MDAPESTPTPYVQIKRQCLCGDCTASTFIFWRERDMTAEPPGASRDRETGLTFMVRCDYFRFTVYSPQAIEKCEGYKRKGGDKAQG